MTDTPGQRLVCFSPCQKEEEVPRMGSQDAGWCVTDQLHGLGTDPPASLGYSVLGGKIGS